MSGAAEFCARCYQPATGDFCWLCDAPLCESCWEQLGHCGDPEAEQANRESAATSSREQRPAIMADQRPRHRGPESSVTLIAAIDAELAHLNKPLERKLAVIPAAVRTQLKHLTTLLAQGGRPLRPNNPPPFPPSAWGRTEGKITEKLNDTGVRL